MALYKKQKVPFELCEIDLLKATDSELKRISKERQLSLSLEEMHKIREHFKKEKRNPTDIELESVAQCWSEHCSYKTSKPILRNTVFKVKTKAAVLPIAEDAGVVEFDKDHYYVVALESHNHPSALDPYGGAATGIGGILRDVACMGAQPVALMDPLFFGPLDYSMDKVPEGVKHPDFLFRGVVKGIADYGNRVGIPTTTGMVYFDESYVGNCLVNVGCVGIMKKKNLIRSRVGNAGDIFILTGGSTGRDGIHGVTFASAELEEKSEQTSRPAVQLGDPITKEPLIHACLEANEKGLLTGLKDLGGGGLSCVVGEMAFSAGFGAEIDLDKAPLREKGMAPWEIWVSESQERMMLSVKQKNVKKVMQIFELWDVSANIIGKSTKKKRLILHYKGKKIYDMDLKFTTGAVEYERKYEKLPESPEKEIDVQHPENLNESLLKILSSYNISSKEWVIRQYDHVIRGNTILSPMQGEFDNPGPGDASIVRPVPGNNRGLAFSTDVNPRMVKLDPYWGAASAVEESFRNLIAVGAKPHSMNDCPCFGNPEKPKILGQFKSACDGLYFAANSFKVPFVSGNVSFYNESHLGAVLPTPTILSIGIIKDVRKAVSMDLKEAGNSIYLIGETFAELGGSEYFARVHNKLGNTVPRVYPDKFKAKMSAVLKAIDQKLVKSCHDLAEGGLGVALAEMSMSGGFGIRADLDKIICNVTRADYRLYSESNGRFLLEIEPKNSSKFEQILKENKIKFAKIGETTKEKRLVIGNIIDLDLKTLYQTWKEPIYKVVGE